MRTLLLLLLLLLAAPAAAEPLTLEQVLRHVEQHHPKIRGAEVMRQVAAAKVLEKEGAFDAALAFDSDYLRYNSSGSEKTAFTNDLAFRQSAPSGLSFSGGVRMHRGSVKSPQSTTGQGGEYFLEFKLPLLRNFGVNEKSTALEQARVGVALAEAEFRRVRLETLADASFAYWDWAGAAAARELYRANLTLAEDRAGIVRQRAEAGDLPRIDVVEAEAEVARRREALTTSERKLQQCSLKLSYYLFDAEPQGPAEEMPSPRPLAADELALQELAATGSRPELSALRFEKELVSLDRELAENDRQPILDLVMGPGYDTGRGGIGATVKAGLVLTVPLATRGPDGRVQAARLKADKLDLETALELRRVLLEVRDAASALEAERLRAEALEQGLDLARRLEEAERLRFELGDSTLFLVNQRERATLEAELKVLEARAGFARAQAAFRAAGGSL